MCMNIDFHNIFFELLNTSKVLALMSFQYLSNKGGNCETRSFKSNETHIINGRNCHNTIENNLKHLYHVSNNQTYCILKPLRRGTFFGSRIPL